MSTLIMRNRPLTRSDVGALGRWAIDSATRRPAGRVPEPTHKSSVTDGGLFSTAGNYAERRLSSNIEGGSVMARIERIDVLIQTGDVGGAGTDGDVYLGIAGREFFIDSDKDDFERGSSRAYRFGENSDLTSDEMLNRERNDPRDQRLLSEFVDDYPVYIRFAPENRDDQWNLKLAVVALNSDESVYWTNLVSAPDGIWLGTRAGLVLHLQKFVDFELPRATRNLLDESMRVAIG
jgi:hypothetical protein